MPSHKYILVVEDRPEVRKLIQMATKHLAYEIDEACNGEQGLASIRQRRPDIVLLDIMMPGQLDGLSVCRAIKGDPQLASIPVVLLSALAQQTDLALGAAAGADAYLTKPFSIGELIATIQRFVD